MRMDRSWLSRPTLSPEYKAGIQSFLELARKNFPHRELISCPCSKCSCCLLRTFDVIQEHLVCNRFLEGYSVWYCHGEPFPSSSFNELSPQSHPQTTNFHQPNEDESDDMQALIQDVCGLPSFTQEIVEDDDGESNDTIGMQHQDFCDKETKKFQKFVEDANEELYKGCKRFSRLSFIVRLFHIKCMNGWSSKSFSMLMSLLSEAFPDCNLPIDAYGIKQYLKSFGLGYEKIHACPNDCILYKNELFDQQSCHVCGTSRCETNVTENAQDEELTTKSKRNRKPAKVLRYFPLIPRLQRLFMSSKTSSAMRWHKEGRKDDGLLRHPADSEVWKSFDDQFLDFSRDHRNVRFGLASDGFNPFRQLSISYSTWPVILVPYNMPPWQGMKQSSFILSMIIPGPKGPGNDIDVYLEPLIEELQKLWDGVDTYDATSGQTFKMKAALLWTINDFPALSMMSGQTTKGRFACPVCGESTRSRWLVHGRKFCYMGHRRWLEINHKFRLEKDLFDGTIEHEVAPIPLSGREVLSHVDGMDFAYGKGNKRKKHLGKKRKRGDDAPELDEDNENPNDDRIWKKRSIFFNLPYWHSILLRHNINFMHTEKNVAVNFIGTILGVQGVSKDNEKARLDLVDMFIRHELHPESLPNGQRRMPIACYTMSKNEKTLFFKVLKNMKLPDGYSSNISKSVNEKESKLQALKSHDFHILMQDLLPVALRRSLPKHVTKVIIEVCNVFKGVCSKVLDVKQLEALEYRAALALCKLEKIFVPSFFTIMVHLVIHLASQAKIAGPVHYRWMYPVERYWFRLKGYVKNKAHPEGSMAEGHLAEESAIFSSRYLEGIETRFSRPRRNEDTIAEYDVNYLFSSGGRSMGKIEITKLDHVTWVQAHRYVLFQHEEVKSYVDIFLREVKDKRRPGRYNEHELHKIKNESFHSWFSKHVSNLNEGDVSLEIKALAAGPNKFAARFKSFIHNGRRFHTKTRELHLKSQNSGILVTSKVSSYASSKDKHPIEGDVEYYGVLTDILELYYNGVSKVVLFRGDWVDIKTVGRGVMVDDLGFKLVNFKHLMYNGVNVSHEPFVISSQVQQVFYMEDHVDENWHDVLQTPQRDAFAMSLDEEEEPNHGLDDDLPIQPLHFGDTNSQDDELTSLARTNIAMDDDLDDDLFSV